MNLQQPFLFPWVGLTQGGVAAATAAAPATSQGTSVAGQQKALPIGPAPAGTAAQYASQPLLTQLGAAQYNAALQQAAAASAAVAASQNQAQFLYPMAGFVPVTASTTPAVGTAAASLMPQNSYLGAAATSAQTAPKFLLQQSGGAKVGAFLA
jgi:hypothetical protein